MAEEVELTEADKSLEIEADSSGVKDAVTVGEAVND